MQATFAGGCFWCSDAVFRMLKGVKSVVAGYSGGEAESPTYEEVSGGVTGHHEAIQIEYDPDKVSYKELLDIFWASHNPTQSGGQGNDIGSQYEAAILYHNEEQKRLAENSKKALGESGKYKEKIVTEILPYKNFYKAEDYHQNYYSKNPSAPYCKVVIDPKVAKIKAEFGDKLK
ncbi:MAG: peptide-methionine (S)-S-oxide reductase MsrA [Candidatus Colwellbacteria bacterium]|nr:peptide-methionine (S)-S-oxide reductase MsrA [Candidatus Colwellbacteria bacterium]